MLSGPLQHLQISFSSSLTTCPLIPRATMLESHADPADLAPSAPSDAEVLPATEEELEAELAKIDSHSEKSALIKRFKASKN